jgi:hypothetical protein
MNDLQITINDLKFVRDVFQVLSERGAFKANELSAVGKLYDKLSLFVTAAESSIAQNSSAATAASGNANE